MDSAYLVKADLEDKVGALTDEIHFLRSIYDEVSDWEETSNARDILLNASFLTPCLDRICYSKRTAQKM